MLILVLFFVTMTPLTLSLLFKHAILYFATAAFWLISGVQSYTTSTMPATGIWDVYYALFLVCAMMTLACAFLPAITNTKKSEEKGDIVLNDLEQTEKYNDELWGASRIPRIGRRGYASRRR